MLPVLRDGIWQFIGAFLALIALGYAIFQSNVQKNRKSLSCRLLAETELFRHVNEKFKTTYDGRPVKGVFLIIIKVLNDGNVPIEKSDFDQALTFSLGTDAHVLSAELIHVSPESLKPEVDPTQSSVTVRPLLLNRKDEFDVKILCDGYTGNIKLDTRIVGIREVEFFKSSTLDHNYMRIPRGWVFVIYLVVLYLIAVIAGAFGVRTALELLGIGLGLSGIFLFISMKFRLLSRL